VVNVIGALPGTDTRLEGAPIVVCAHLDHDGVDATRQIYNGADDNASGAAAVVEIAGAFARAAELGRRPRRPVVFALWNAEEKGLLGSRYYVEHPEPAGSRPAAVLNLDMIGRSEEIPDRPDPRFRGLTRSRAVDNADALHLLGYTFSPDLAKLADEENRDIGLRIRKQYDHHPIDLLRRSDHWPFLLERIPALFVTTGLHPDYHTPQDDADRIDFAKVARIARLVYRVTWRLADADDAPAFVAPVGVSEP
jgi:Zn-dependent M28 family amino/carboxypeptidase